VDKLPNIFIFGSDATRADMIKKEIMPYLYDFSKTAIIFKNHHSGGNTTRFGIFSLFYGLNATYWFSFLNEQKGGLLFDASAALFGLRRAAGHLVDLGHLGARFTQIANKSVTAFRFWCGRTTHDNSS